MKPYRFTIPGKPVVQQRARRGKHGNFYDPSKEAKDTLAWEMLQQKGMNGLPLLLKEVALEVVFYGLGKGDLDNAVKALMDAGNGILWKDDKQIICIEAHAVRKSKAPRTSFIVKEI